MSQYKYVSNRTVANKNGEEKGKLRVLVRADSETAEVDYVCPECSDSRHIEKPWQRPFNVKCEKCGFLMKLPKLKGKVK